MNRNQIPGQNGLLIEGRLGTFLGFAIGVTGAGHIFFGGRCDNATNVHGVFTSSGSITNGQWHHVAAVVDWAAQQIRLYIDGIKAQNVGDLAAGPCSGFRFGNVFVIGGAFLSSRPLPQSNFNGLVDEVQVFNIALTTAEIRAMLNEPPVADAGSDQNNVECTSSSGALVELDGSGSSDPDDDDLTYTWREGSTIIAGPTSSPTSQVALALGNHSIELTVDDGNGETDTDEVLINVVDTTPPTITVSVSPDELWSPNHKMVDITTTVNVNDICDPNASFVLLSITSNEPEEGPGKKHFPDIMDHDVGSADTEFQLRAERLGGGTGRIYTITYKASDASGNSANATATVTVPHNMSKQIAFDSPLSTPESYELLQNYPNPFNPETEIRFQIPEAGYVVLKIYSILGQKIRVLTEAYYEAGYHSLRWDARDNAGNPVPSGVYLYQLRAGEFSQVRKMSLMR